jgi:hypothetical protein
MLAVGGRGLSDRGLVQFIGVHGVVSIEHVMRAFGIGRTAAYRRVAACIEQGLLERLELLRNEPSVLRATKAGLRYVGFELSVATVSPGSLNHWLRCTSTALWLGETYGFDRVVTERELRHQEQLAEHPIYSAKLGENPDGSPAFTAPTWPWSCKSARPRSRSS